MRRTQHHRGLREETDLLIIVRISLDDRRTFLNSASNYVDNIDVDGQFLVISDVENRYVIDTRRCR